MFRLLEEVFDCQKLYNSLLKKTLDDQKDQMALLKSMVEQNIAICSNCCCHKYDEFDYENCTNDKDLIEWLRNIDVDEQSIKKVCF